MENNVHTQKAVHQAKELQAHQYISIYKEKVISFAVITLFNHISYFTQGSVSSFP